MESRVFCIQEPRPNKKGFIPNLTGAKAYGSIHFIFDRVDSPCRDPVSAIKKIHSRLINFDSKKDFILDARAGDSMAMTIVLAYLFGNGFGQWGIRFLHYRRPKDDDENPYTPITVYPSKPKTLRIN